MLQKTPQGESITAPLRPSNRRTLNPQFTDLLHHLPIQFTDARQRMLKNEHAFFGFLEAESMQDMQDLYERLSHASLEELQNYVGSYAGVFRGSNVRILPEKINADGQIVVEPYVAKRLGFISIRDPNKPKQPYALGVTSCLGNGDKLFMSEGGEGVVIDGETSVDIICGRLFLKHTGTEFQEIVVNDLVGPKNDIALRLTGAYRQPRVNSVGLTRGVQSGDIYENDHVARMSDFRPSHDTQHHYDLDVVVRGTKTEK